MAGRLFRGPFYSKAASVRCWGMGLGTERRELGELMYAGWKGDCTLGGLAVRGAGEGADEDSPHFPVSERRPGVLEEEPSTRMIRHFSDSSTSKALTCSVR